MESNSNHTTSNQSVEQQVAEDTCLIHGVFCCPDCFNMEAVATLGGPGEIVTYIVTAVLPAGTWVLEVPTSQGPLAARRRAMFALIAKGVFEPEGSPEDELERFTAQVESV